jgi:ATP-dependent DNA helicase RecG
MLNIRLTKSLLKTTTNYIDALEKAWIKTVGDLVNHFPREYDDRTDVLDSFSLINIKEKNTILVTLLSISSEKTAGNKILTKAVVEDKNWFLSETVWFNRKYLSNQLKAYTWKKVILSWKVKYAFWKVTFMSPEVETNLSKIGWSIVPIYPELNYLPSKWIEGKILLLKSYFSEIEEVLPEDIVKKYSFIDRQQAFFNVHFPNNKNDIELWRARLGYEELFEINYKTLSKKYESFENTKWKSVSIKLKPDFIKEIIAKLDFELTDKQKITLFQILKDMEKDHSMARLLEWDVWTGKTIVALIASIHAIKEIKIQVTFMAPTEILARQHFNSSQKLLWYFWIRSHLLVGSTTKKQKGIVKQDMKDGNVDIIFGTHALVQDDVLFNNLWLVIIDEQHRFWVKQREVLESGLWNRSWIIPHSLNMTATPIPRTLALTLYWDQDLSIINEYPKWRQEIFTKVISSETARGQVEIFVRSELEKGRQIFWISPLVEESEKIDLANAVNTYEYLNEIFHPYNIGLLHWKMKPKEKQQIMSDFNENKIQVLSSTSVVEVWVDVPNATIMCIEWAERFWLSQLHQFRWRVWRGKFKSHCYLFPSSGNKTDRLKAMEKTNNWFELSEIDLEIRWPWEVYGLRQSWVPDLKIASLTDLALISDIREDIEELFEKKKKAV